MTISTLLIEDEELAQTRLRKMLQEFPLINIIGSAFDGIEGTQKIDELKPDLIFLDIEMPGKTGFELLASIKHRPQVIFTTAYDHYAIKAFEENSIDYLLKPIEKARLAQALQRVQSNSPSDIEGVIMRVLEEQKTPIYKKRLQVKIGDRILLLQVGDITHFESQDKYTTVHTDDKEYIIDTPLVELEKQLNPEDFLRIHRSILVNQNWISEIHKNHGGKWQVQLTNTAKSKLGVSRNFTDKVRHLS